MEFTVPRNDLAVAVTYAVHGVPNNPMQPVRAGMRIYGVSDQLHFAASDGDVTFKASTGSYFSGDFTVPGKLLADVAKTLPDKDVHFITDDKVVTLNCGRVQFKLPIYKGDYPGLPDPALSAGTVQSEGFAEGVRKVIPAASRSDSNPALASVYLEPNGDTLWAVCTDRYRLAAAQITWEPQGTLQPVLVPSWAVDRFTRSTEGTVTLGWDDRVATFACDSIDSRQEFTSRIWEGEFPKTWRTMLPAIPCNVDVSTENLLAALKRAQLAADTNSPVELTFSNGRLHVEAGYDNHADDILDATYNGDEFKVLFGINYLIDGLAGCGPVSSFGFTDPHAPVYVTSGGYSYTVLPRRTL